MLTVNNGKPIECVQGKNEDDALDCFNYTDKYDYVSRLSTIFTFLKKKKKQMVQISIIVKLF